MRCNNCVVLLWSHLWLSLASPLPSTFRCRTIGLSCDVPRLLTADYTVARTAAHRHRRVERGKRPPCLRRM